MCKLGLFCISISLKDVSEEQKKALLIFLGVTAEFLPSTMNLKENLIETHHSSQKKSVYLVSRDSLIFCRSLLDAF